MHSFIKKVEAGSDLSRQESEAAMEEILSGRAKEDSIVALLAALRAKGETVGELVGFARAMRSHATPVFDDASRPDELLVDTCGTGGDASGTFNISTAAAFVAAGAGVHVAKHGNRSISSKCGSADVLEALGNFDRRSSGADRRRDSRDRHRVSLRSGHAHSHAPRHARPAPLGPHGV